MLQSIAEGQQQGLAQAGRAAASIDRLSPEQKNRIKELERQQALGLLGLDAGQQQRILSQQLQPVQSAEREAIRRSAQGQMIGDVGQGSTFRGQQALLEAGARARTQATSAAQQQIAELDELARARQLNELAQLRRQQQQNRAAVADMVSGIIGGSTQTAAGIAAAPEVAATQREEREIAMLNAKSRADEARAALEKKTINKVSDKTVSGNDYFEALEPFAIKDIVEDIVTPSTAPPVATPSAPASAPPVTSSVVPAPTSSGSIPPEQMIATVLGSLPGGSVNPYINTGLIRNPALDAMVTEGRLTEEEAERIRMFLSIEPSEQLTEYITDQLNPETEPEPKQTSYMSTEIEYPEDATRWVNRGGSGINSDLVLVKDKRPRVQRTRTTGYVITKLENNIPQEVQFYDLGYDGTGRKYGPGSKELNEVYEQLGLPAAKDIGWGIVYPILDSNGEIISFYFHSNKGKKGIVPDKNFEGVLKTYKGAE